MELAATPADLCAGYLVEDSDLEYSDCSDSEGESSDNGVENHSHKNSSQLDLSSGDEFEKEMAGEVLTAMKLMVSGSVGNRDAKTMVEATAAGSSKSKSSLPPQGTQFYDEIYFDSSESEGDEVRRAGPDRTQGRGRGRGRRRNNSATRKVQKLTNDELFYDPNMDEEDEKWVNRRRMEYHNVKVSQQLEQQKKEARLTDSRTGAPPQNPASEEVPAAAGLPKSDAVLNCPACMSTLCMDCQRHTTYSNQYRAMFVLNCRVMRDEVLQYIPKPSKKRKRPATADRQSGTSSDSPGYHPVRCSECNTEVAVVDTDEVFHFFNVLPSAPNK